MTTTQERKSPKPYQPSPFWWVRRGKYVALFLREITSIFILAYVLLYSFELLELAHGEASYTRFLSFLGSPAMLVLSVLMLVFAAYNSITWFNLLPKVQPVKFRGRQVSQRATLSLNILLWLIVSYILIILIFR